MLKALLAMENRWSDQWRTAANYVKSNSGSCSRVAAVCSTSGLSGSNRSSELKLLLYIVQTLLASADSISAILRHYWTKLKENSIVILLAFCLPWLIYLIETAVQIDPI